MSETAALDHEQQYRLLENEILHFQWKPGEIISENYLCQRFSLSRTPVRSLLQRLRENGLVQIEAKRGSLVTKLSLDTINQLIYERVAVESMVLRDYIAVRTPTDVEKVRYLYAQMEKVAADYGTNDFQIDSFLRADLGMHSEWFRRMNLSFLWKRLSSPQSSYTRFCMLDILAGGNVPDVMEEHAAMLRLIENGDASEIEPLLTKHLYGGVRRLGPHLYTTYANYFEPLGDEKP
ncbi:MAG: GntR family transcriptional regulator [Clostridia bacterium]|nr:GntR family transcriptional regulator [Clostridia bacterium]